MRDFTCVRGLEPYTRNPQLISLPLAVVEAGPLENTWAVFKRRGDFVYRVAISYPPREHTLAVYHAERQIDHALERALQ